MKRATAPAGFYTDVEVTVTLESGRRREYAWSTPIALSPALHKAPAWARREMSKQKVKGRSKVTGITVRASYVVGKYGSKK